MYHIKDRHFELESIREKHMAWNESPVYDKYSLGAKPRTTLTTRKP
jgi:hypothetical protein